MESIIQYSPDVKYFLEHLIACTYLRPHTQLYDAQRTIIETRNYSAKIPMKLINLLMFCGSRFSMEPLNIH